MKSLVPENYTRMLAENQPEFNNLAIVDQISDGQPVMSSLWEPSPEELEVLNNGGFVVLRIMGNVWPPVILETQSKD